MKEVMIDKNDQEGAREAFTGGAQWADANPQTSGDDEEDAANATTKYWDGVPDHVHRDQNGFYDGFLAGRQSCKCKT